MSAEGGGHPTAVKEKPQRLVDAIFSREAMAIGRALHESCDHYNAGFPGIFPVRTILQRVLEALLDEKLPSSLKDLEEAFAPSPSIKDSASDKESFIAHLDEVEEAEEEEEEPVCRTLNGLLQMDPHFREWIRRTDDASMRELAFALEEEEPGFLIVTRDQEDNIFFEMFEEKETLEEKIKEFINGNDGDYSINGLYDLNIMSALKAEVAIML